MVSWDRSDFRDQSTMECPRGPRQPLTQRRARSLDRLQSPRKVSEPWDSQCLSLPANPSSRGPPERTSHEGRRRPKSPGPSEALGTTGTALLEGTREFLTGEQRPPQDTKKDKAQGWAQQGWLKTALNFLLRLGPEEPHEKASKRTRGKDGLPQPAETSQSPGVVPAPRKKAHDKKANRKKHGHKKHVDEETRGSRDQEAEGQEVAVPKTAAVTCSEEADPGPGPRGGEDPDIHQPLPVEGRDAGVLEPSSEAPGPRQEEEFKKLDQDTLIRMIVQVLREVGDHLEVERLQASQPEMTPQNTRPAPRKKSQEKKSAIKRTFSHKKHGSEEPRRGAAADASGPESRPSKRSSFLYLCVGGHRPSISSSLGVEEPEVQEALSTDGGGPRPSEFSSQAGSQGPGEDLHLQPDSASECREFIQKIIALLQDEEQETEQDVQGPALPAENPAPHCRKKSQEKKSSFRKAFSHKKHSSKEPKRAGAGGAASPEFRSPRRPNYLPLCMGGHRASISSSVDLEGPELQESPPAEGGRVASSDAPSEARSHKPKGRSLSDGALESKELIIQKLVALLQKADGHLGEQIRRHPSFKRFFYQLPDSSLRKLAATLRRQAACSPDPDRNLAEGPYPFAFGLANKFASRNYHAVLSLMGLRYPQLSYMGALQNISSPETQSPD
ncbi:protein BNIP5 isoform 2-T2 [Rhynchonycteris naso]